MRTGFGWLVGLYCIAAAPAFAQSTLPLPDYKNSTMPSPVAAQDARPTTTPNVQVPAVELPSNGEPIVNMAVTTDPIRFWARAEYLLWWVKNAPMPVSLVTGDPMNPTQELLNTDRRFGPFSGMRFTAGAWLDPTQTRGVEVSFFSLQQRTNTFAASSDSNGTPTLQFPFVNTAPGAVGNTLMPITFPGIFAGGVTVTSDLQLWGAEANAVRVFVPREAGFELSGLVGVRYMNLKENLDISTVSSALLTTPNTVLAQTDQFGTRNEFYGGQLGARLSIPGERFTFDMTAKVALGSNHQIIDINGASAQSGPGGPSGVFPGGFFTQPSNMGHFTSNQFAVIPAIELKVHYSFTRYLNAFVGYDFMYWSSVVRPGSQVDRNINLTQSSVLGNGALIGAPFPAQSFNRTDFWAQGISFGCEFRY